MKTLHLTLKKKWFDMILRGEKKEEYREIKDYWCKRFCTKEWFKFEIEILDHAINFFPGLIEFTNGYGKNAPRMTVECRGISVGTTKPEWCDDGEKKVFVIKLGNILHHMNCNPIPINR